MDNFHGLMEVVDGFLPIGCFHVLAIVNSAAMNTGIHVFHSVVVSSGYIPGSPPVFLTGEAHGQRSLAGYIWSPRVG